MENININSVMLNERVLSVLRDYQRESESVSAMYADVIEDVIDYLLESDAENVLGKIRSLRMLKKDIMILSGC